MSPETLSGVEALFGEQGPLARAWPGYRARDGQIQMAKAVEAAIASAQHLIVEAGTGVGKTFAYLLPALSSGRTVLISTATKALQDQVYWRDLPAVAQLLGVPVRAALLKGRSSYLCRERFEQWLRREPEGASRVHVDVLHRWGLRTTTGDLSEIAELQDDDPVLPLVTSTRDNCLGSSCPRFGQCHVVTARREALQADVVVVNHHLFFADVGVRQSGFAELLPSMQVIVFDEAHQLNAIGREFLGESLSTSQLEAFAQDLALQAGARPPAPAGVVRAVLDLAQDIESGLRPLRKHLPAQRRTAWDDSAPQGVPDVLWNPWLTQLQEGLGRVADRFAAEATLAPEWRILGERCQSLRQKCAAFSRAPVPGSIRWVESSGRHLRMTETPLRLGDRFAAFCGIAHDPEPTDGALKGGDAGADGTLGRTVIFTSATLGDDRDLTWFARPLGLEALPTLRVQSPFDYIRQSALFVDRTAPDPSDSDAHTQHVTSLALDAAQRLGGSTLVLTTSLRAMESIGQGLRQAFNRSTGLVDVLVQGEAPKRHLLDRFRSAGQADADHGRGSVLVASFSFWEGIDVPGDALRCLVIDKIPFPVPTDPLHEAQGKLIAQEGGSAFFDHSLPEAIVLLRQGVGRLIRREADAGVVVVADPRLVTRAYGKRILAALPPMRRLANTDALRAALDQLATRSSTTGPTPDEIRG